MDNNSSARNSEPIRDVVFEPHEMVATRIIRGRLLPLSLMRFKGDPKFGSNAATIFIFR